MYTEAELFFIKEELDEHGSEVATLLSNSIESLGLVDSGELLDSIQYTVTSRNGNGCLSILFETYGRFIEIAFYRKRKSVWQIVDARKVLWGIKTKEARKPKRKDTRFYTKNVYGSLNRLIGRISYAASDDIMQRIKDYIQQNPNYNYRSTYVNKNR